MSTTAQFHGEISHGYYSYFISILFSKQSHSSCFLGFLDSHNLSFYFQTGLNLFIYQFFYFCDLFLRHRLEMSKVKTKTSRCYKRTFLLHVCSQNSFQSFLKQMGSAVVLTCSASFFCTYFQCYFLSLCNHTGNHSSHMTVFSTAKLNGIFHLESSVSSFDHTGISFLSTHSSIERSIFYKNRPLLSLHQGSNNFFFCGKYRHCGSI